MAKNQNELTLAPLTGVLDLTSNPDLMAPGSVRMRQNLQTVGLNKLRRGCGWQKLLSKDGYNNSDFHDQLLTFTTSGIREPITMIYEAVSTRRVRKLFVGTHGKIAVLNEHSGNYQLLGSGYGGSTSSSASTARFHAAHVGDYIAFTNDSDKPMYHQLEVNGIDTPEPLKTFDDLDTIGLTRAACVWAWNNCLFFADVEMDGDRYSYRIVWSNFNDPTSFDPARLDSITGYKDLFTHERILAGAPLGSSFLIYTTAGIWEMNVVGGEQSFSFVRRYNGEQAEGSGVMRFPNTLVPMTDGHIYGAANELLYFNPYSGDPTDPDWLQLASTYLYENIDQVNCSAHVAGYANKEIILSFASTASVDSCPDKTLRISTDFRTIDVIDHGFTAFGVYHSNDMPTIRDFMVENGICTLAGLVSAGYTYLNEGLPNQMPEQIVDAPPTCFYTTVIADYHGETIEDFNQATAAAESLCFILDGQRLDDICRVCEGRSIFVAASSQDWCLKQIGDVFYRERCTNPTAVGSTGDNGYSSSVGTYEQLGYDSIIRFAPMVGGKRMIQLDSVMLAFLAVAQNPPSKIGLRVGVSAQVADPNSASGLIVWHQHSLIDLKTISPKTMAQHLRDNTIPSELASWNLYRKGKVLYVELAIPGVGGDALFSSISADAHLAETTRY